MVRVEKKCIKYATNPSNSPGSQSKLTWKGSGSTERDCFIIINRFLQQVQRQAEPCNYCKIDRSKIAIIPDLCLLCRKRSGDCGSPRGNLFIAFHFGCVNILHERGGCHQSTALHQKQPFLVRG